MPDVYRQEIWKILGSRPALVISADELNNCPADLIIVVPITTTLRKIPSHIPIKPPEGGLKKTSYLKCDQVRTVSKERLAKRLGNISDRTMSKVENVLRIILCL
jgi:mRNA interferase MazF